MIDLCCIFCNDDTGVFNIFRCANGHLKLMGQSHCQPKHQTRAPERLLWEWFSHFEYHRAFFANSTVYSKFCQTFCQIQIGGQSLTAIGGTFFFIEALKKQLWSKTSCSETEYRAEVVLETET